MNVLGASCCCDTVGNVLIMNSNNSGASGPLINLQDVYADLGATVDVVEEGDSPNMLAYRLIFLLVPDSDLVADIWDPIEDGAGEVSGGVNARVVILTPGTGPHAAGSRTYINSKTGVHGVTITNTPGAGSLFDGTVETDDLTAGQTPVLKYGGAFSTSGGTALSKRAAGDTADPGNPWIARNTVGWVDFVVAGSSAAFSDVTVADNIVFLTNLLTVDIPTP